jgi:hypothetical protein
MEALLKQHGFLRMQRRDTLKWSAELYVRANAASHDGESVEARG